MFKVTYEDKFKKQESFKFKTRDEAHRKADDLRRDDYKVISIEEFQE